MSVLCSHLVYTAPKWPINQLMENAERKRKIEQFLKYQTVHFTLFNVSFFVWLIEFWSGNAGCTCHSVVLPMWEDVVPLQTCLLWLYTGQLIKATNVSQLGLTWEWDLPSFPRLSSPGAWLPLAPGKGIIRCLMTRWGPEEGQIPSLRLLMCGQTMQPRWPLVCRWKEAANQINYSHNINNT